MGVPLTMYLFHGHLIGMYLKDCVDRHGACCIIHRSFLSTRLIKVTAFENSTDIKLIETKILINLNNNYLYIILNYC